MQGINDPANYRKLSEPFESSEAANEALNKFYEAIRELRNEHKMMDVHIITRVNVMHGEDEGEAMSSAHFGNTINGVVMCAWALGQEQAEFKALIQVAQKAK